MIQSVTSCCQREESIGSNRAETQAPNLVRVLSPSTRIERNVFSCSSTNEVAELNAKSAWAARSPAGSVWPARTCVVSSSGPCLIHDFYRRQPLSIRFGNDTSGAHGIAWRAPCSYRIESNGTGGRAPRARASADIGTSAGGPSAWLVRETRCPISPPGDAPIATPGVTS